LNSNLSLFAHSFSNIFIKEYARLWVNGLGNFYWLSIEILLNNTYQGNLQQDQVKRTFLKE